MYFKPKSTSQNRQVGLHLPSMIDVVFLLLIFFLFSAIIAPSESQLVPAIHTKNAGQSNTSNDFTPQVVFVEARDGQSVYRVGSRIMTDRSELVSMLAGLPHDLGVFVRVEDATSVAFAVAAIQSCYDAGFDKVTYVPQSR